MPNALRITKGEASMGAVHVGSGDVVYGFDFGTVSVNPASIPATSRGATTFTLTGAKVGDVLVMNPPAGLNDDLVFAGAAVTADNTGTVYLYNPTAGAIDDAAATWTYLWVDSQ
jgi:regulator of RNase E activity RraA